MAMSFLWFFSMFDIISGFVAIFVFLLHAPVCRHIVVYELQNLEEPILTVEDAVKRSSFFEVHPIFYPEPFGDIFKRMQEAELQLLSAELRLKSQYLFYMEPQTALVTLDCGFIYGEAEIRLFELEENTNSGDTWDEFKTTLLSLFVVDNSKILVTPLSWSLMPPPMYLFSLSFSSVVRDIAYYSRNSKNCLAVFFSDGNLSFVEFPTPSTWEDLEGRDFNGEISDCKTALGSFVHLQWLNAHSLLCVSAYGSSHNKCLSSGAYETDLHGSYLQEVEVVCYEDHVPDQVTFSGFKASVTFQTLLESPVMALAWNPSKRDSAFVEFEGGKVLGYASRSGIMEARISYDSVCFPSTCPLVKVVQVDAGGVLKPLLCGLDDMGRLYINGKSLCNNCSSFSCYSELANEVVTHLIFLTTQDFLFIVDTKDVLQERSGTWKLILYY